MFSVTLKGWSEPHQHPSESCLPDHLYCSDSFQSVKLMQLLREVGLRLADSKNAIHNVMCGHDFVFAIEDELVAKKFVSRARKYGAEVEI
ncbi:hypothetical protein GCM10025776_02600 [Corallincola platygyrae]